MISQLDSFNLINVEEQKKRVRNNIEYSYAMYTPSTSNFIDRSCSYNPQTKMLLTAILAFCWQDENCEDENKFQQNCQT